MERYFSIFKPVIRIYQHCDEKHLHLAELTSATTTARRSVTTTLIAWQNPFPASLENALPIGGLVQPNFKFQAARFMRWRKKHA